MLGSICRSSCSVWICVRPIVEPPRPDRLAWIHRLCLPRWWQLLSKLKIEIQIFRIMNWKFAEGKYRLKVAHWKLHISFCFLPFRSLFPLCSNRTVWQILNCIYRQPGESTICSNTIDIPALFESLSSSSRNCHNWICPEPATIKQILNISELREIDWSSK